MSDLHVERLHYEIDSGEGVKYEDPETLTFTNALGSFDASDGKMTIVPGDHFSDEAAARAVIDPFLRAWEIRSDLELNIGTIRFKFLRADVIDRDPPPASGTYAMLAGVGALAISGTLSKLLVTRRRYPAAPEHFRTTVDVERAHSRWVAYRAGKEPLPSMAYFVLTLIKEATGSLQEAAQHLNVHVDVLRKVGELSSTRGDAATARKVGKGGTYQPLSGP
jgi:hypothetical protein